MVSKLQNIKYTTMMFIVVSIISITTIAALSYTSIKTSKAGLDELGRDALYATHSAMLNSLNALNKNIKSKLNSDLLYFESQIMNGDPVSLSTEKTKIGDFNIPIMMKGDQAIYSNPRYVDNITQETGAKATIFQLVEDKLVRISTSVIKEDGKRAIGTYVSSDSPVFKAIMRGDTFLGKAFVVDDWYLTAYAPLYDDNKNIIGAIFVGGLMLNDAVRELVTGTKIGEGYFFVYSATGDFLIHPTLTSNIFDLPGSGAAFKNHNGGMLEYVSSNGVEKVAISEKIEEWDVWIALGIDHKDIIKGIDKKILTQSLVVGMLVLLFGIGLNFLLIKLVNGRVQSIADIAKKVGDGDYRVSFSIQSKDALGSLSDSLNEMVAKSKEVLAEINMSSETLASSATELSSVAEQLVSNADETTSLAEQSANNANEVSSNMDSVAAASEQSATNLSMISVATEEMGSTIQEIAENSSRASTTTSEAVEIAERAKLAVESLGVAANSIGKVTETITEISEQTNLLALNATIEAARAGEAGKGFAVVANEIKELAKETANATGSIKEAVNQIQSQTSSTISDIGSIAEVIANVNEIVQGIVTAVEEQAITTNEIVQNVSQATTGIAEVNENISSSSSMTADVSRGVELVKEKSQAVKISSEDVNVAAGELSKLAETLSALVARFKI